VTAAPPGQAALSPAFARWYRIGLPLAADAVLAAAWANQHEAERAFWAEVDAAQEPHAAPELQTGPCPFQGHHGEHLRLNTHDHWLCAITLTNMLVAADVIADPAPDVTKLRAELDEEQGYRSELTNDILLNAPESFDGDEAADVIAVRYVRHLEAEIAEHAEAKPAPDTPGLRAALVDTMLRCSGRDAFDQCASDLAQILDQHPEPQPAPELAAAMRETKAVLDLLDDFTHAVIDLDDGARLVSIGRLAAAARGTRTKAGLPS
jgi:hypothetical protein